MKRLMRTPGEMILAIDDRYNYASVVNKKGKISLAYVYSLLPELERIKIIQYTFEVGNIRYFRLTEKGKQIKKELLVVTA